MTGTLKVDQILRNDGSTPTPKELGLNDGGNIIKIYRDIATTQLQPSSNNYFDIGLEITLTPRDANSQFLLNGEIFWLDGGGSGWHGGNYRFLRDGSTINVPSYSIALGAINGSTSFFHRNPISYLDSPATASSITYKIQVYNYSTSVYWCYGGSPSYFTIYEIAG